MVPRPPRLAPRARTTGPARLLTAAALGVAGVAGVAALPRTPGRGAITIDQATARRLVPEVLSGSVSRAVRAPSGSDGPAGVTVEGTGSGTRVGAPVAVPPLTVGRQGSTSAWTPVLASSTTTRWDPCLPVPVRYDPTGAPWDLRALVADRVAQLARLSGLDLRMDSIGTRRDGAAYGITVGWSTTGTGSDLTAGVTSPLAVPDPAQPGRSWLVHADVRFGSQARVPSKRAAELWAAVVTHELLHALGLGHTDEPSQVMAATTRGSLPLGAGDLVGISRIAASNGCRTTA